MLRKLLKTNLLGRLFDDESVKKIEKTKITIDLLQLPFKRVWTMWSVRFPKKRLKQGN